MKLVNNDKENLHLFQSTWGISIKIFRKNVSYDNIKSHKKQGFTPSLENTVLKKPHGWGLIWFPPFLGLAGRLKVIWRCMFLWLDHFYRADNGKLVPISWAFIFWWIIFQWLMLWHNLQDSLHVHELRLSSHEFHVLT